MEKPRARRPGDPARGWVAYACYAGKAALVVSARQERELPGGNALRWCSLGHEEHFPHVLAPFEETMRPGGVTEGEGGGDGHLDGPAPDELQRRRKLVGGRQPEANDAPAVPEQGNQVKRNDLAGMRTAGDERAFLA